MRAALLAALLVVGAAPRAPKEAARPAPADAPTQAPAARALLQPAKSHPGQTTSCGACHTTSAWAETRFAHDKTGFPLLGKHLATGCKGCHPVDFQKAVPSACAGCHLDVHAGELGARCEGCHGPESWKSRFPADAHRRTGFPLVGRHAGLPCGECHLTEAAGRFSRSVSGCAGCHQREYDRTASTALNHAALGFPLACELCHAPWSYKPALFATHDVCFPLAGTEHAAIGCSECHTAIPSGQVGGTCNTRTAACTGCHEHACAKSDPQHAEKQVQGYQCRDLRCYECHKFGGGAR